MFEDITYTVTIFIEVVVVTFLILLFGEIIPKIYASRNRVKFASFMAYPLRVLDVIIFSIKFTNASCNIAIQNKLRKTKI